MVCSLSLTPESLYQRFEFEEPNIVRTNTIATVFWGVGMIRMFETPSSPQLEFVLALKVSIGPLLDLGGGLSRTRRTVPVTGGTFSGPLLAGRILPGGADWQIIEADGLTLVDARYVLETSDGARIEVRNRGLRHGPSDMMDRIAAGKMVAANEYYFRTSPQFHPPAGKYDWLRRSVFVGVGERYADLVLVGVWKVH